MSKPAVQDTKAWDIAVELKNVSKTFIQKQHTGLFRHEKRAVQALHNVDLTIRRGEFVAYAGPNGAGKSTTFKLLCGMLVPDGGQVRVMEKSPQSDRVALMQKIGLLFGGRQELWWDHAVIRSFEWKRDVWGIPPKTYQANLEWLTELLDLKPFLNSFVRELSLGQRMRAELAMMLLHDPELILLDEPTLGLDVLAKRRMIDCLRRLNREKGSTILVTSHDMDDLTAMAHRLVLVNNGSIAFDGTPQQLTSLTGDRRLLWLACKGSAPEISGAVWQRSEEQRHLYAFNGRDASRVLAAAAQVPGLADIEMSHAPIEELIANVYERWMAPAHRK